MGSNSAEMLNWAQQTVPEVFRKENLLHRVAVSCGTLVSLQWLTERGYCDWKNIRLLGELRYTSNCTPELFEYLVEQSGHPPYISQLRSAAETNLAMLKHLHKTYHLEFEYRMLQYALHYSDFEMAKYIHLNSSEIKLPGEIAVPKDNLNEIVIRAIHHYPQGMRMTQLLYSLDPERFCYQLSIAFE
jgi:hypothetical protein